MALREPLKGVDPPEVLREAAVARQLLDCSRELLVQLSASSDLKLIVLQSVAFVESRCAAPRQEHQDQRGKPGRVLRDARERFRATPVIGPPEIDHDRRPDVCDYKPGRKSVANEAPPLLGFTILRHTLPSPLACELENCEARILPKRVWCIRHRLLQSGRSYLLAKGLRQAYTPTILGRSLPLSEPGHPSPMGTSDRSNARPSNSG